MFDGIFKNGEEVEQRVMVLEGQMIALFGEEGCLEDINTDVPIKIGLKGANSEALKREFGVEAVARAPAAWRILINQITYLPLLNLILAAGSPSDGWKIFTIFYAPQSAAEKSKLTQAWYSLRMKENEPPNKSFARGSVLISRLAFRRVFIH